MSLNKLFYNWMVIILVIFSSAGCISTVEGLALPKDAEIAFSSWRDKNIEIHKITSSSSDNLTNTLHHDSFPVWSPEGDQLAFLSSHNGEQHLAVMDADGSNKRLLAPMLLAKDVPPSWAFDAQMIAFACTVDQRTTICLTSVTGNWTQIMPGEWALLGSIQWAPADPMILFHALSGNSRDIFLYTTYTNRIRNLTNRNEQDFSPTWSPDGRKIAFVSNRNAQPGIYIMNIDGSNPHLLLSTNIQDLLHWSPNGKQIAFNQITGENHLCIFDTLENTLHCTEKDGSHPTWSPDGQFLVYESLRRNKRYLYLTDNLCKHTKRITYNPAGSFSPAWRP